LKTFAMIKPDAVAAGDMGAILYAIESRNFVVRAMRMCRLQREHAEALYDEHKGQPFYEGLIEFSCSGPSVLLCLERGDAVDKWRREMGATDPCKAQAGTLRRRFGTDLPRNAVHGSDNEASAARELLLAFGEQV